MPPESTLTDQEIVEEVRTALAGIGTSSIPDDTIVQAKDRFVVPILQQIVDENVEQDYFDNAVVAWTAEKSFDAWLNFTRLRDAEMETYTDPSQYKEDLVERTDNSLFVMGATRPPQTPNTVVTIKHDGIDRKVRLRANDELLGGI